MLTQLPFKAIILDMDGVLTNTRELHFNSWKIVFETFLKAKGLSVPFTKEHYQGYVDGKPRSEGIKSFLEALGILPSESELEVLSREKNLNYLKFLETNSPIMYSDVLESLKLWKSQGIKLGVVSSSENCRIVLKKFKLEDFFTTLVDGIDGQQKHLRGKPFPDYFLEAVEQIGVQSEECALVEDSVSGVIAAKKAHFKTIYGMSREGQTPFAQLYESGADAVITSLLDIGHAPHVLTAWDDFIAHVGSRDIALFIDYDGTLSNIVSQPSAAVISEQTKNILESLSKAFKVAIVSGRDRLDIKERIGLDNIFYSGCHGFDISGPGCFHFIQEDVQKYLPALEEASIAASNLLGGIHGLLIEKKLFATAIHYRMVEFKSRMDIKNQLKPIIEKYPQLILKEGKKVFDILPNVNWDKGKAVNKICEILSIDSTQTVPLYVGDDLTDEDAFLALHGKGISIKVDSGMSATMADYHLNNPGEVTLFLERISKLYSGKYKRWRPGP